MSQSNASYEISDLLTVSSNLVKVRSGNTPTRNVFDLSGKTDGIIIPLGTSLQRPLTPPSGTLRFNTSFAQPEIFVNNGWQAIFTNNTILNDIQPKTLPHSNDRAIITGTNFVTGMVFEFIGSTGVSYVIPSWSLINSGTVEISRPNIMPVNEEPFSLRVTLPTGPQYSLIDIVEVGDAPFFILPPSGSLGTFPSGCNITPIAFQAYDSDGSNIVTMSKTSDNSGLTFTYVGNNSNTSNTGILSGITTDIIEATTQYNFTVSAMDSGSNVTNRSYSLTVLYTPLAITSFQPLDINENTSNGSYSTSYSFTANKSNVAWSLVPTSPYASITSSGLVNVAFGQGVTANGALTIRAAWGLDVVTKSWPYSVFSYDISVYPTNAWAILDTATLASQANNSSVTSWGVIRTFKQATTANQPTYVSTGGYNNGPYVFFNRTNSTFLNAGAQSLSISTNGGFTLMCFMKFTGSAGNYERIIDFGSGTPIDNILFARVGTTANLVLNLHNSTTGYGLTTTNSPIVLDEWCVLAKRWIKGNKLQIYKNNVLQLESSFSTIVSDKSVTNTYIGKSHWADAFLNAHMSKMFTYDRALSDSEMSLIYAKMINAPAITLRPANITTQNTSSALYSIAYTFTGVASSGTVVWSLNNSAYGSINVPSAGVLTLTFPRYTTASGTLTVTATDSNGSSTYSWTYAMINTPLITSSQPANISQSTSVASYTTLEYTFTANQPVTWTLNNSLYGAINSSTGVLQQTFPINTTTSGTFTVTATNQAGYTVTQSWTYAITNIPSITSTIPADIRENTFATSQTRSYSFTANQTVTWSLNTTIYGNINSSTGALVVVFPQSIYASGFFIVTATNASGYSATQTWAYHVPSTDVLFTSLTATTKSSVTVAYSLRKMNPSYTGALVKVRRSTDNVENDFFGSETVSVLTNTVGTTLSAWLGVANGHVSVWYDQSGAGRNATQTTTSYQPLISFTQYAFPTIYLNAGSSTDAKFLTIGNLSLTAPFSVIFTSKKNTAGRWIAQGTSSPNTLLGYWNTSEANFYMDNNPGDGAGGDANVLQRYAVNYNSDHTHMLAKSTTQLSYYYMNGYLKHICIPGSATNFGSTIVLGGGYNTSEYSNGYFMEMTMHNIVVPTTELNGIQTSIRKYYSLPSAPVPTYLSWPDMTAGTQVGTSVAYQVTYNTLIYEVSAFSHYNNTTDSLVKAFDKNGSTAYTTNHMGSAAGFQLITDQYIRLKFPTAVYAQILRISIHNLANRAIKDARFQASTDDVTWVTIFTWPTQEAWTTYETRDYFVYSGTPYQYFKLQLDSFFTTNGSYEFVTIREFDLLHTLEDSVDVPYSISGLQLNLDAAYHNQGKTTWVDRSPNKYNFTVNTAAFRNDGGIPHMNFEGSYGSAKRIVGSTLTNVPAFANATIIAFSTILNATSNWRTLIRSATNDAQIVVENGANNLGMYDSVAGFLTAGLNVTSIPNFNDKFNMLTWKLSTGSPYYQFKHNDTMSWYTITNVNALFAEGFASIGAYHNLSTSTTNTTSSQYWGKVAVFLYFDKHLTDGELMSIFNYYKPRFNLQATIANLPIITSSQPTNIVLNSYGGYSVSYTFTANQAVSWSINNSSFGVIDASSGALDLVFASDTIAAGTFIVTATNGSNYSTSQSWTYALTSPPIITSLPPSNIVQNTKDSSYSISYTFIANRPVTWSLVPVTYGNIDPSTGVFELVFPQSPGSASGAFTVTATVPTGTASQTWSYTITGDNLPSGQYSTAASTYYRQGSYYDLSPNDSGFVSVDAHPDYAFDTRGDFHGDWQWMTQSATYNPDGTLNTNRYAPSTAVTGYTGHWLRVLYPTAGYIKNVHITNALAFASSYSLSHGLCGPKRFYVFGTTNNATPSWRLLGDFTAAVWPGTTLQTQTFALNNYENVSSVLFIFESVFPSTDVRYARVSISLITFSV